MGGETEAQSNSQSCQQYLHRETSSSADPKSLFCLFQGCFCQLYLVRRRAELVGSYCSPSPLHYFPSSKLRESKTRSTHQNCPFKYMGEVAIAIWARSSGEGISRQIPQETSW